jgi:hypothetical protein
MPYNLLLAAMLAAVGVYAAQQFYSGDVIKADLQEQGPLYCPPCECPACPSIIEPLEEDEEAIYATEEGSQTEVSPEDG